MTDLRTICTVQLTLDGNLRYRPGQVISGRVRLNSSANLKCAGVVVVTAGFLIQPRSGTSPNYLTVLLRKNNWVCRTDLNPDRRLLAGQHEWNFSQVLPADLPMSFYHKSAAIIGYVCECYIVGSTRKQRMDYRPFAVVRDLDLGQVRNHNVLASQQIAVDRIPGRWWCFGDYALDAQLSTLRKGYVSGERLYFAATVTNSTRCQITRVLVSLVQVIVTPWSTPRSFAKLAQVKGPIQPGEEFVWEDGVLLIPRLPPTGLGNNYQLCSVQYQLHMCIQAPSFVKVLKMDIIIGSAAHPLAHVVDTDESNRRLQNNEAPPSYSQIERELMASGNYIEGIELSEEIELSEHMELSEVPPPYHSVCRNTCEEDTASQDSQALPNYDSAIANLERRGGRIETTAL